MGFAPFVPALRGEQDSGRNAALLPDDWKGGVTLLFLVFVLSSFLDNIAARPDRRDGCAACVSGQGPYRLSRRDRRGLERGWVPAAWSATPRPP